MERWQLQDAKNRFSELMRRAREEGPQVITRHGRDAAVLVSAEAFRKISKPAGSLAEFVRKSPLSGLKLELRRSRDTGRDLSL
jgi:antitoxin Phd